MANKKDLSKFNIETLFGGTSHTNGKFDVNTLFNTQDSQENFTFDSNMLIRNITKKKEKLNECYNNIYKSCCTAILSADNSGLTDIIYEVQQYIPECLGYDSYDCICYIKRKLSRQKISCLITSTTKLFISWKNIDKK
jgi:hypothetical protein